LNLKYPSQIEGKHLNHLNLKARQASESPIQLKLKAGISIKPQTEGRHKNRFPGNLRLGGGTSKQINEQPHI
jgi:hypothetical protein